uniref:Restriction endonuclease n=1 Tax=Candidatus Kentrum sp. FM TaxID=2126340 RepID=A0A450W736_9GAMM|nr:MAG: hypothetical protein BECKFM1743A_GA0114220_102247 [Candidatus Kentron sp. FM]VFJ60375.1 MAG: hypothetical protein BECKFM1743C_GA0114222_102718 [Candidatus Kentron sp. FM]VFK12798.1 MAG: hypothetical protein BECKFM1743B_GA0114221_102554 [Candidatus Kentron sp. FM]
MQAVLEEINGYDGNKLLNTPVDDLAAYFERKYRIDVPSLHEDEIVADQRESQIDVSHGPRRRVRDRGRPVAGTEVEITIPFDGEVEAFNIQPSTFTLPPPIAEVRGSTLVLSIRGTDLTAEGVRSQIDRTISEIENYLQNLRRNAAEFNGGLLGAARTAIERRRDKLLKDQGLVSALGFPLKERTDASRTYSAPDVRRKIQPRPPEASSAPYKPEPELDQGHYEHILGVVENMAHVMERSPSAFSRMDEEALRSHFLVQLNGHFEGAAAGETFNYAGKTDILVRVEDKNIFIGECKFWGGPKKLTETIDQILSYSAWRDTKVAILIFNRNKNFSAVLEAIPPTVKAHSNYKRTIHQDSKSRFRYTLSHKDDASRELTLTVLVFDVPRQP